MSDAWATAMAAAIGLLGVPAIEMFRDWLAHNREDRIHRTQRGEARDDAYFDFQRETLREVLSLMPFVHLIFGPWGSDDFKQVAKARRDREAHLIRLRVLADQVDDDLLRETLINALLEVSKEQGGSTHEARQALKESVRRLKTEASQRTGQLFVTIHNRGVDMKWKPEPRNGVPAVVPGVEDDAEQDSTHPHATGDEEDRLPEPRKTP